MSLSSLASAMILEQPPMRLPIRFVRTYGRNGKRQHSVRFVGARDEPYTPDFHVFQEWVEIFGKHPDHADEVTMFFSATRTKKMVAQDNWINRVIRAADVVDWKKFKNKASSLDEVSGHALCVVTREEEWLSRSKPLAWGNWTEVNALREQAETLFGGPEEVAVWHMNATLTISVRDDDKFYLAKTLI